MYGKNAINAIEIKSDWTYLQEFLHYGTTKNKESTDISWFKAETNHLQVYI